MATTANGAAKATIAKDSRVCVRITREVATVERVWRTGRLRLARVRLADGSATTWPCNMLETVG